MRYRKHNRRSALLVVLVVLAPKCLVCKGILRAIPGCVRFQFIEEFQQIADKLNWLDLNANGVRLLEKITPRQISKLFSRP